MPKRPKRLRTTLVNRTDRKRKRKSTTLKDGTKAEWVTQAEILQWLDSTGLLFWRANSGAVFVHGRRIVLGPDGIPDVVVVVPPTGRLLGLEVKSSKGKQRPDQVAFQARMEAIGATYKVVKTLQQAMDAVAKEIGSEAWKQWQESGSLQLVRL